jgi:hypothetical protein
LNVAYLDFIATAGAGEISHIALVNGAGTELSGGGYARRPVTWTASADGLIRPSADLEFSVDAGAQVAGWRGFNAASGGTNYDGATFAAENFTAAGTFTLLAASTFIDHDAV